MDEARPGTGGQGEPSTADTGTAEFDVLAETLSSLVRDLEKNEDPDELLVSIVAAAVSMVPGAEEGSISVVAGRRVTSEAASGDLPEQVDAIQNEVQQGPCLDAVRVHQTVRSSDLTTEQRWPLFARRAAAAGAASMLSLQLYVSGDNLGALNLFSRSPHAFTDESEQVGLLFATHAALAYATAKKETQFAAAIESRDVIGQAKGMLMERYKISSSRAFMLLTRVSQNNNRKLHDVAEELVRTGAIAADARQTS